MSARLRELVKLRGFDAAYPEVRALFLNKARFDFLLDTCSKDVGNNQPRYYNSPTVSILSDDQAVLGNDDSFPPKARPNAA